MMTNEIIDYFLQKEKGNYRSAMAWLIGRMDGAERFEQHIKSICGVSIETTVEAVERTIKQRVWSRGRAL